MSSLPSKAEQRALHEASVAAIPAIKCRGQKVVTTELLAQLYGTEAKHIQQNYSRNTVRFEAGLHYFKVSGQALQDLRPSLRGLQISAKTRSLILWTERGAARHAKMIETDQAWDVFAALEDHYFKKEAADPEQELTTYRDRRPLHDSALDMVESMGMLISSAHKINNAIAGTKHYRHITMGKLPTTIQISQRFGTGTATPLDYARVEKGMMEIYGESSQLVLPLHDPPNSDTE